MKSESEQETAAWRVCVLDDEEYNRADVLLHRIATLPRHTDMMLLAGVSDIFIYMYSQSKCFFIHLLYFSLYVPHLAAVSSIFFFLSI